MRQFSRCFVLAAVLCFWGNGALRPLGAIAQQTELLDINMATQQQLQALPGMGAAYAARIVAGRPYTAKNQLMTRGVLPASAYDRIKERIVAHRVKQ